ncbi:hypothetical protein ACLK2F_00885 [Escherichia coli]
MQQVVQRGTGRQLGAKYPNLHLAGKTGTTNNNVDTWFAGIDGSTVTITWVGRDNDRPTKLYGASGAMSIYQRYLANQTPTPLNVVRQKILQIWAWTTTATLFAAVDGGVLPVWTSDPQSLCQQARCSSSRQAIRLIGLLSRSNSRNSNLLSKSRKTATV